MIRQFTNSIIVFCFLLFGNIFQAMAQNNTITGKVIDAVSGEPLPGAAIRIENTTLGTTTDLDGNFKLSNIRTNTTTILVSYVSYQTARVELEFDKERVLDFTIELANESTNLDEVVITGSASGQVKAMLDQKTAINIKNIVSSEQIQLFPDMNAAEAVNRIPGISLQRDQGEGRYVQLRGTPPELTNFNINGEQIPSPEGDVRYVGLDIISADQIERIEISKVLTPDMDADGIGGNVNIITKSAESETPDIQASLSGGYNNLRQTENAQLQFSYGQRVNKFGFKVNSNYYVNNQGSDNMEFEYAKGPFFNTGDQEDGVDNYKVHYREMQLRHYNITRERIGVSANLDYRFNPNSVVYLRGMFNRFGDDEIRRRVIFTLDDPLNENVYLYGGVDRDVRQRNKIQQISTVNLGGEHDTRFLKIDYEAAVSQATDNQPDRVQALFDNPGQAINIQFDNSDPDFPVPLFANEIDTINATNYEEYEFEEMIMSDGLVIDRNLSGRLNIEIPYEFANQTGYFKFGGKFRFKEKTRDYNADAYSAYFTFSNTYPGTGQTLTLPGLSDGFVDNNLLDQGYTLDFIPSPQMMVDFHEYNSHFFIIDRTGGKNETFGQDYLAREDIYAAYGMLRHDIGNLMIIGGLRYERTFVDYEARSVLLDRGRFDKLDTVVDSRTHDFWLPQFQMRYAFNDNFNLRFGYTHTFARPNFSDVLPYRQIDRDEVEFGNPDLIYPTAQNVDFLIENYLKEGGIISGGLFYKKIDDFIFYFERYAREGDVQDVSLNLYSIPINGIEAFVYGAEIQTQSKLHFLPGFAGNFGVFLNYTYTYSEALIHQRQPANYTDARVTFLGDYIADFTIEGETEQIELPGQAPHAANLALFFDNDIFFAKIAANYHDDFLYELGADNDLDRYYHSLWHLDFTTSYRINDNITVFADLINLTNAPLKFYLGSRDRILQQEYYSWWGRTGVRMNF